MNLSVLKASFRKCPCRRCCRSVVNCARVARSRISPWVWSSPTVHTETGHCP